MIILLPDFMAAAFKRYRTDDAIIWRDQAYSYGWLLSRLSHCRSLLLKKGVAAGQVTVLEADFTPNSVALFLALLVEGCILVPLTSIASARREELTSIAQSEVNCRLGVDDQIEIELLNNRADHELYRELKLRRHPGLVLFSSGSTGKSKAVVHDLMLLLQKFRMLRHRLRTIPFLLYDHIGGVNTLLYTLSNGGCLVVVQDRSPDAVLAAVAKHRVELLPTSPTFINLILLSEAYRRHDLSSLKTVTYGTEPMPEITLREFNRLFPSIRLIQTYGLSELGILRSKSRSSDSLWLKVGGEGFETRIVDGILHIRAESSMLGYLNASSPFTAGGWFITGDVVEQDGEYIRFLGRDSDIINVAGEKVFPAEVENVIQQMVNVAEATVQGEANPILGNIICARVRLRKFEEPKAFTRRLKEFCGQRLERYKVPVKVTFSESRQYSDRFKKLRRPL